MVLAQTSLCWQRFIIVKAMIFPVVLYRCGLDHRTVWMPKNRCLWTVVLKTLESPLDSKEIKPVDPKANQCWIFTGRTDIEAEVLMLWPPDVKSWPTGKDPDGGKYWGQGLLWQLSCPMCPLGPRPRGSWRLPPTCLPGSVPVSRCHTDHTQATSRQWSRPQQPRCLRSGKWSWAQRRLCPPASLCPSGHRW